MRNGRKSRPRETVWRLPGASETLKASVPTQCPFSPARTGNRTSPHDRQQALRQGIHRPSRQGACRRTTVPLSSSRSAIEILTLPTSGEPAGTFSGSALTRAGEAPLQRDQSSDHRQQFAHVRAAPCLQGALAPWLCRREGGAASLRRDRNRSSVPRTHSLSGSRSKSKPSRYIRSRYRRTSPRNRTGRSRRLLQGRLDRRPDRAFLQRREIWGYWPRRYATARSQNWRSLPPGAPQAAPSGWSNSFMAGPSAPACPAKSAEAGSGGASSPSFEGRKTCAAAVSSDSATMAGDGTEERKRISSGVQVGR